MRILFAALLSLAILVSGTAQGEEIRVGGGSAALITILEPVKPHFEKATGITLINLQSSPKSGLTNLLAGKVDVAAGAHSLESMVEGLRQDGVEVDASALVATEIGINRIVLLVHPANPVSTLSRAQIKGIFTGKIGNWKEVGGEDRDILVVWGKGTPGQNAEFVQRALDGESVVKDVLATTNYADIRDAVAVTPEAIGIDPVAVADSTVKVIDCNPPLKSPINAVTLGKPSAKVRRLLDYVIGEGRSHLRQ